MLIFRFLMRSQLARVSSLLVVAAAAVVVAACGDRDRPRLAQGAAAPDFSLPGVDGKMHSLGEYADSRVLAVVFTGNSCPASQLYEARIRKLARRLSRQGRDAGRHQSEQAGRDCSSQDLWLLATSATRWTT